MRPSGQSIDFHIEKKALTGEPDECGDIGFIKTYDNFCFLALVDVLGHGKPAAQVALLSKDYLAQNYTKQLTDIINGLHGCLRGTRGAVVAACRLDIDTGILQYSGMGNIHLRLFGTRQETLVTKDGIVGYMIPSPVQAQTRLLPGDILVMTSDGIKEHFDLNAYPGITTGQARDICNKFITCLGKGSDDLSCIALRFGI
ncbi:SpoIIE family protein phosphatase [Desulfobacter curvatus]|uniref:SpoIIE family protein phosphatase n=1 Tax=Desulfobacter curvatus TaxID=2290 RepID=UPI00035D51FB|nr:SpoIIE family protein phosphatase [Desulfobacter curvatus]